MYRFTHRFICCLLYIGKITSIIVSQPREKIQIHWIAVARAHLTLPEKWWVIRCFISRFVLRHHGSAIKADHARPCHFVEWEFGFCDLLHYLIIFFIAGYKLLTNIWTVTFEVNKMHIGHMWNMFWTVECMEVER